ncbi:conserved Plasmodium protein, unknown function [Plasmodium knowlesi strain H]|uniref:Uncharacterized protein n=3 Tax=Plasmodium knowlesi TaxID=5850 RepID=A0A5K1V0H0_PLAKH|nr:uncharacterized protein PKNH_1431300 [Plasmodium knowlesi strain H]OTN63743.1 Uncharacterized protein PKNOH_S140249200 [Plasmodium knowlesi]CAA9990910.1 conserved protein, unknown function [Plasmodium knowlesi strain H]SBO20866.1 conserved Plasmodium protein, unknown function [Plasmodium knowlesi strain H]SBO21298.1 conserved Plasmodium protein, unknown function [Plasmodium knowlesi strain H]VVS80384.1 conserved protein, unknown function [Plasmodium knowlesi strain H]|eukprot:XP_002262196.1 [Plasmodium knowlesi strain H]
MLLKNTLLLKRFLQCVHFNVTFPFKHGKGNSRISKRHYSIDGVSEKKGAHGGAPSFRGEIGGGKGRDDAGTLNTLQYHQHVEYRSGASGRTFDQTFDRTFDRTFDDTFEDGYSCIYEGEAGGDAENLGTDEPYVNLNQVNREDDGDEFPPGEDESLRGEEDGEEFEDDIDTLLFTNNLNSSLIGNLWHASANSVYRESWKNAHVNKEGSPIIEGPLHSYPNERENQNCVNEKAIPLEGKKYDMSYTNAQDATEGKEKKISNAHEHSEEEVKNGKINDAHMEGINLSEVIKANGKIAEWSGKNKVDSFINEIYKEEQKEVEKMKEFFEKNEKNLMKFRNSILCKLKISQELPKKFKHLSKDTNIFNNENAKEKYYKKLIDSLNKQSTQEPPRRKHKFARNVNYDQMETIKILDIDSVPLDVLNNLFAYKIVKNCSAELCLKIISRIGMYRDKYSQVSYENMINYLGQTINHNSNAEIIALFSRCYETVSIPFLVNFVRKYATFSRSFIVNMYDKYFRKRLFDFVRYENNFGIRKLPNILTHPYHLSSYIKLLGECSAKKDMYIQLKMRGHVPHWANLNQQGTGSEMDCLPGGMNSLPGGMNYLPGGMNYLPGEENHPKAKKITITDDKKKFVKKKNYVERPKMYDVILSAEYTGLPIEHFIEKEENFLHVDTGKEKQLQQNSPNLLSHPGEASLNGRLLKEGGNENDIDNLSIYTEDPTNGAKAEVISAIKSIGQHEGNPTHHIKCETQTEERPSENINFTMEEECDVYVYKGFSKLNESSLKLQTMLVKTEDECSNELALCPSQGEHYEEVDKEQNDQALWELPWKTRRKNSFFFKGRFFKVLPNEGWSEIKDISNQYIRPKRKRTKHSIRRRRFLQKKIKINLFKKKILQK